MTKIKYTKTSFKKPSIISEEFYDDIKTRLIKNPRIEIDTNTETFNEHFSGYFKTIGICIGLSIICGLIIGNAKVHILIPIIGISMFTIIIMIVYLLIEGPFLCHLFKRKKRLL